MKCRTPPLLKPLTLSLVCTGCIDIASCFVASWISGVVALGIVFLHLIIPMIVVSITQRSIYAILKGICWGIPYSLLFLFIALVIGNLCASDVRERYQRKVEEALRSLNDEEEIRKALKVSYPFFLWRGEGVKLSVSADSPLGKTRRVTIITPGPCRYSYDESQNQWSVSCY